jgi:hypothetical protein
MLLETPSVEQLSRIIGSVAAPAFLLGAVAAFISVLISRMNRVIDRSQFLHGIGDADSAKSYLKADIPRLKSRAALLNRAVFYATLSAIATALLIIVAFVLAMLHVTHEYGVAILFIVAIGFFCVSLVDLARETRIALHEFDYHQ